MLDTLSAFDAFVVEPEAASVYRLDKVPDLSHSTASVDGVQQTTYSTPQSGEPATAMLSTTGLPDLAVSIIIDDVGYSNSAQDFLASQIDFTYAVLPFAPQTQKFLKSIHAQGHEIILHLPMQATAVATRQHSHDATTRREPLVLEQGMDKREFIDALQQSFSHVAPFIKGLNNHQGSVLTADKQAMSWLMQFIKAQNDYQAQPLYVVDSRTTKLTVLEQTAQTYQLPTMRRHVFLDNQRDVAAIKTQLRKLIKKAKRQGYALAIGHPYPETLQAVQAMQTEFTAQNIKIVPVSTLLQVKDLK